ncbi:MAG TPA: hypothetical protein VK435_08070 [Thermodesulfovibrionales bacterium]|nr:hypothetical protein [Thermodesulfovibrionales bacterium]
MGDKIERQDIEGTVRDILEGLGCILSAHDSCAEFEEYRDNRVVINCIGPCLHCDNKCIEDAIKTKLPDVEVILR